MKTYTYSETEYFVLQHLYYAMGKNRMKWYEYKELMIPSLKKEIMLALAHSKDLTSKQYRTVAERINLCRYNSHDIDTVIRKIKEKFEIFGHYEGYRIINEYIKQDMAFAHIVTGGK